MKKSKVIGTLSLLIASLAVFVWINEQLGILDTHFSDKRSPASQIAEAVRSASQFAERKLIASLARSGTREMASIGRTANELEKFQFGILEGKYHVSVKQGFIDQIAFIDNPNTEGRPTFVRDRMEFLKSNKRLLGLGDVKERVSIDLVGTKVVETYRVGSNKQDTDVLVKFVLDDMDRLIGLEKQNVSALKYF